MQAATAPGGLTDAASLMREGPRDFTVIKDVGDGSFGTVCLADWKSPLPSGTMLSPMQHPTTRPEYIGKRLVAIKKMKKPFPSWQECMKLKELSSLLTIPPHPNIIPLYDAFLMPTTKELHFVFECMEGNLYQLTKSRKGRPLAAGLVASIYEQIVLGLDHIHQHGYFHRDMKPENLLITTTGLADYPNLRESQPSEKDVLVIVKLADFGLARETDSKPPYTEYVSTRWYRAPEVLLRSRDYSNPVDMWALGTILAELVNLKPLFPGHSEVDQVLQICDILGDPSNSYGIDSRSRRNGGGPWDRGIRMARAVGFTFPVRKPIKFSRLFTDRVPQSLVDCIEDLLRYDPKARLTSKDCIEHHYMRFYAPRLRPPQAKPVDPNTSGETISSRDKDKRKSKGWGISSVFGGGGGGGANGVVADNGSAHQYANGSAPSSRRPSNGVASAYAAGNGSHQELKASLEPTPAQRIAAEHATSAAQSNGVPAKPIDPKKAKKEAEKAAREAEKAKREAQQKAARDRARAVMQKRQQILASSNNKDSVEWLAGSVQADSVYRTSPSEKARGKQPAAPGSQLSPPVSGLAPGEFARSPLQPPIHGLSPDYGMNGNPAIAGNMAWRGVGAAIYSRSNKARRREHDDDHSMSSFEDGVEPRRANYAPSIQSYQTGDSDPGPGTGQHGQPGHYVQRASSSSSLASAPPSLQQGGVVRGDAGIDAGMPAAYYSNGSHPQQQMHQQHVNPMFHVAPGHGTNGTTLPPFSSIAASIDVPAIDEKATQMLYAQARPSGVLPQN
uniref:Protein kinase n=1 Tax=Kalmanozyma brasiliensis (strain GHG001) TaxID=1365824 RepID=V5ERV8_KALBG